MRRWYAWIVVMLLCVSGCKQETAVQPQTLEIHVIAAGNAESVLLVQGEHAMLLDASDAAHVPSVVACLREKGIEKLEYVLQTFPSLACMGGMEKVIRGYDTAMYLYTPLPERFDRDSVHHERLQNALKEEGVVTADVSGGMTVMLGDATVEIYPTVGYYREPEGYATVCRVTYGDKRFLLFSQTDDEGVYALLNSGADLTADVVKLPQNGAKMSSTLPLLGAVAPRAAVIACEGNRQFPHRDTRDILAQHDITVWRTDLQGDLTFVTDGKSEDCVTTTR